ncbi:hypothetical protein BpHYR1_015559 [Brachionus plicatilis]|uniref:Uncharacterized protein n=1 Tax=Brachionus plicatilis TaxID=10195 RepID=A0A3M7S4X4_BRAPC|nr:hypothetical protein BpHYR1_015559 [Brachionus plicatilis]
MKLKISINFLKIYTYKSIEKSYQIFYFLLCVLHRAIRKKKKRTQSKYNKIQERLIIVEEEEEEMIVTANKIPVPLPIAPIKSASTDNAPMHRPPKAAAVGMYLFNSWIIDCSR